MCLLSHVLLLIKIGFYSGNMEFRLIYDEMPASFIITKIINDAGILLGGGT